MLITCPVCGKQANKLAGEVNRARRAGYRLFCGRECAGVARRDGKSKDQRRAAKAAYDANRRVKQRDKILSGKRAYYIANRERFKAAGAALRADPAFRAKMKAYQHEWVRRPAVRAAKKAYDRRRRAVLEFGDGDVADAVILIHEINDILRPTRREVKAATGRYNLCQNRKRRK